ncbi:uncharacterized protein BDR25DRAFT_312635 [Lindgomyces ingoldianus]|uniref:Uncharacterized protein n=1 Tax=Lindgomyces ingoldianus TaxID=673940 RepID=A0ACB6R1L3_9PLEO|nr:uncharacterized protein BDR25DRAFT_312635 [Lindgomyces ingoldianus]KAF2472718.1 hypothetical protein BDR25DRAFT_312635 [Lindgomyces ingoldianus]
MKLLLPLLFVRCIIALPAAGTDPTPGITLDIPTSSGGICFNGSVNTVTKTVNSTTGVFQLVHTLDTFTPWTEPSRTANNQRRNCVANVDIGIPSGYRARANTVGNDVSGYIQLEDAKMSALFIADYSFASNPDSVSSSTLYFVGPMNGRFTRHADVEGKVALSSCGGDTLKTAYRIRGLSASSSSLGYSRRDLEPDDFKWVITTGVEILKC